jgi:hypothetical protein
MWSSKPGSTRPLFSDLSGVSNDQYPGARHSFQFASSLANHQFASPLWLAVQDKLLGANGRFDALGLNFQLSSPLAILLDSVLARHSASTAYRAKTNLNLRFGAIAED